MDTKVVGLMILRWILLLPIGALAYGLGFVISASILTATLGFLFGGKPFVLVLSAALGWAIGCSLATIAVIICAPRAKLWVLAFAYLSLVLEWVRCLHDAIGGAGWWSLLPFLLAFGFGSSTAVGCVSMAKSLAESEP